MRLKVIDLDMDSILGIGIFEFGSVLLAVDPKGNAKLCGVPQGRRLVKKKLIGGCARCGKVAKYVICKVCGMGYCSGCLTKQVDPVCVTCEPPRSQSSSQ
jgi:hypothetical protein